MKIWEGVHFFEHAWQPVSAAHWRKYPNPFNPAVVSTDILARYIAPNGNLVTHRLMATRFSLPRWVSKLIGDQQTYVVEISEIDPKEQSLTLRTKNITLADILVVDEAISYRADPQNPSRTKMTQECQVKVHLYGTDYLENQFVKSFAASATKGRQAMEHVIALVNAELRDIQSTIHNVTEEFMHSTTVQCEPSMTAPTTTSTATGAPQQQ
jgi:hypothetical protein